MASASSTYTPYAQPAPRDNDRLTGNHSKPWGRPPKSGCVRSKIREHWVPAVRSMLKTGTQRGTFRGFCGKRLGQLVLGRRPKIMHAKTSEGTPLEDEIIALRTHDHFTTPPTDDLFD